MEEIIVWHEGRPNKEGRYLIQDEDGDVAIAYYNGNIFRYELEADCKVVRYANEPVGKR